MIFKQGVNSRDEAVTHSRENLLVKVLVDESVFTLALVALILKTRSDSHLFKDCLQECQEVFLSSVFPY